MLNVQPNKEGNLVERKRETPLEKVKKEVDGDVASGGSSNVPPATPEISSSCHFSLGQLVGAVLQYNEPISFGCHYLGVTTGVAPVHRFSNETDHPRHLSILSIGA
jgi:hypothetical protein